MSDFTITPGTVEAIQTIPVSSTAPTTNQVLEYNGTEYVPTNLPTSLPPSGSAGGDLGGTYPNPTVVSVADVTTGVLPTANQAAQTMGGDVSGTTNAATVVALQGNAVESGSLGSADDGYVLTWHNASSEWQPQPVIGLRKNYFTSNGTWVAPAGVTTVILMGAGGGGGGGPAYLYGGAVGGGGGSGSIQVTGYASVTPGNSYTITIGTGGAGGIPDGLGGNGGSTSFGTSFYANGASGGITGETAFAGQTSSNICSGSTLNYSPYINQQAGTGGPLIASSSGGTNGSPGVNNFSGNGAYTGGAGGTAVANTSGGGGGGAGPQGNGSAGANGVSTGTGPNASNAGANTGAGGGGGGGTAGGGSGGNGGNGGSGYLYIIY